MGEPLHICTPVSISESDDPRGALLRFGALVGAERVEDAVAGIEDDGFCLVGPRISSWVRQLLSERLGRLVPEPDAELRDHVRAWAVYLPPEVDPSRAPMVKQFRVIDALGKVPVLVSEGALRPGELLVVPESSEVIVAIGSDERQHGVDLVKWWSVTGQEVHPTFPTRHVASAPAVEEPSGIRVTGPLIFLDRPLLDIDPDSGACLALHDATASLQVAPVASPDVHALLVESLPFAPWTRRQGEIYTQDSLDLVSWIRSGGGPRDLRPLVDELLSNALVHRVAQLTGRDVVANREVFAYRLRPGERILVHADGTVGGQLDVRMNWLISSPDNRPDDMRFWKPHSPMAQVRTFEAHANSAVLFRMGEPNPHDVCPVPRSASACRYNIVLTFGRYSVQS